MDVAVRLVSESAEVALARGNYWAKIYSVDRDADGLAPEEGAVRLELIRADDPEVQAMVADLGLVEVLTGEWERLVQDGELGPNLIRIQEVQSFEQRAVLGSPDLAAVEEVGQRWVRLSITEDGQSRVSDLSDSDTDTLDKIFSLGLMPFAAQEDLAACIDSVPKIVAGVTLSVGHGTANALICDEGEAVLYCDMGGQSSSVKWKASYCTCAKPPIILSHFHQDHFNGAICAGHIAGATWIVPAQLPGPGQSMRVRQWLQAGARIHRVDPSGLPRRFNTRSGNDLELLQASGKSFNDSGLIVVIRPSGGGEAWVFPGDAAYRFIPRTVPQKASVLLAPHHGSNTSCQNPSIAPADKHSRVIYSCKPRAGSSAPGDQAITAHEGHGWRHASQPPPNPQGPIPGCYCDFESQTRCTGFSAFKQRSVAFGPPGVRNLLCLDHLKNVHLLRIID